MHEFLKENISGTSHRKLTEMFNQRFNTNYEIRSIRSYCERKKFGSCLGKGVISQ